MSAFHPPSMVRGMFAVAGEVSPGALLGWIGDALKGAGVGDWRCGPDGEPAPWPPDAAALQRLAAMRPAPSLHIRGTGGDIDLYRFETADHFPDALGPVAAPAWRLDWTSPDLSLDPDPARLRLSRDGAVRLARGLASAGAPLQAAAVVRQAGAFAPSPPQAPAEALLFLADSLRLRRQYSDLAVYWRAWDETRDFGDGRILVTRGLAIDDEAAFKAWVYPPTWELARAAKAGLTRYDDPVVLPEARGLFEAGAGGLVQTGFDAAAQRADYAADLGEQAHLAPREIYRLRGLLQAGRLADGTPLRAVRVSFPDRATARRELIPLHDIGVEVVYPGGQGQWETARP